MEELNINTYNNLSQYLFWDVLTGLIKLSIVRKSLKLEVDDTETFFNEEPLSSRSNTEEPESENQALEKAVILRLELEFETFDKSKEQAQLV